MEEAKKERLLIRCNASHTGYFLAREGEDWLRHFQKLQDALQCASTLVTASTPLILYSDSGRIILESSIEPVPADNWERLPKEKAGQE